MALRERNAFLVKARGRERAHGLSLHVNIREQDLGYFNDQQAGGSAPGAVQHLLELLDQDAVFQALIAEVDTTRPGDTVRGKASAELQQLTSSRVKAQWQLADHSALNNVLERAERQPGEQAGGAYRPLPMRSLAVAVWMYPPTVVFPPTGEPIPEDTTSVRDFFPSDDD